MLHGFAPDVAPGERARVLGVLGVAVLAVSSAAILVRAIDGAPPLTIALWRTTIVAALLAPGVRRISRHDLAWIGLSGVFLAAHFTAWFASLEATSVMRSTLLVCTGPLWAGVLEWVAFGARPGRRYAFGLAVAAPGLVVLSTAPGGEQGATGDALALLGGAFAAAYWVVGRKVRPRVGIGTYASLVCAAAAAVLLPAALATGAPLVGFTPQTWVLLVALALGPQLLGHNGFNFALRWLPATTVSAVALLEPVGATALAVAFLGERPAPIAVLGALLVLAGVTVAVTRPAVRAPA